MRILLVDDDALLTEVIEKHLIDQHYAVDIATTGEMCLEYIALFSYDLILLDVILPDMNGRALCKNLRQQKYEMPILMMTAQDTSEDKVKGLDSGADDYIVKPIIIDELMAHIRALLRRDFKASTPILEWEKLRLNPSACEVTYDAKDLALTSKEYAILEIFLRNTSHIHTLDSIIDNAWSFEDPPSVDAVRTHIKGLRQKLKKRGAPKDFITTVYGFGYRLMPHPFPEQTKSTTHQSDDKVSDAIAKIWEQNQDEVRNRLQFLVDLTDALSQDQLSADLHQQSLSAAHKLAGSLGCYGFSEGSSLAREIELILNGHQETLRDKVEEITSLVKKLQSAIQVSPNDDHLAQNLPLVLTFSQDQTFIAQLETLAHLNNLKFKFIGEQSQLSPNLKAPVPNIILLDLEDFALIDAVIAEVQEQAIGIPVLARLHEGAFSDRLHLLEHGIQNVLPTSVTAQHVLSEINQVIQSWGQQSKILIVDDDPHILSFLEKSLAPWGLQVFTLDDPTQLWHTLDSISPDLVILDIEMPETDGLELCQLIRADPNWQHLPVLFLTMHEDESVQNYAFVVGADDFVLKPVAVNTLVNRIQNRLRRHPNLKR